MTYAGPHYKKDAWRSSVQNGKIPVSKLAEIEAWPTPIDRDLRAPAIAHPEAASAMGVMLRTAWGEGHTSLTIAYSFRTYAKQLEKWDAYQRGDGNLAAQPGTSNHGWGVAFDMSWGTSAAWTWMSNNRRRFGFELDVPGENWHLTLQEGLWKGDDMTEDEKAMLKASEQWFDGERLYRQKFADKKEDPGAPPDNFSAPKKEGWASARFPVRLMDQENP